MYPPCHKQKQMIVSANELNYVINDRKINNRKTYKDHTFVSSTLWGVSLGLGVVLRWRLGCFATIEPSCS